MVQEPSQILVSEIEGWDQHILHFENLVSNCQIRSGVKMSGKQTLCLPLEVDFETLSLLGRHPPNDPSFA